MRLLAVLTIAPAMLITAPCRAQAPNARPQGGQVVGGTASIAQTPTLTTVTQTTPRAGIDWRSFNVGQNHTVDFVQPSSRAVTLNRVTGPDPSTIAGRIQANGQVVLMNQSGVVFTGSAQVNAQSLIVSAASMSDMAMRHTVAGTDGALTFDLPAKPGAQVTNAGRITVRDAGLAALVAPAVSNSGVIQAKLGHVVLAGGAVRHTLDLYGDGLLSLDVTQQVTEVPTGPDGRKVRALATNDGAVSAEGGTVLLTASAADGLVQSLVRAGGQILVGAGTVALHGIGGDVVVAGHVSATGAVPGGGSGGSVEVLSNHAARLTRTARVDASGPAGGGTIAIGTTLARAKGGPGIAATTAANTAIAAGAVVRANATASGDGGRVVVLSSGTTAQHGSIAARGGPSGGAGGFVEVSGATGFVADGPIDVGAATPGAAGSILFDPINLTVVAGAVPTGPDTIAADYLASLIGAVVLEASSDLRVSASFATQGDLALIAGHLLTVDTGVTVAGGNNMILFGGGDIANWGGSYPAGVGGVVVNGTVQAAHQLGVFGGTLGVTVAGTLLAPDLVQLYAGGAGNIALAPGSVVAGGGSPGAYAPTSMLETSTTGGDVTQNTAGLIAATSLRSDYGVQGSLSLAGTQNRIATIDGTSGNGFLVGGDFSLTDATSLTVIGTLQAGQSGSIAQATFGRQQYIVVIGETLSALTPSNGYTSPCDSCFGEGFTTPGFQVGPMVSAPPAGHSITLTVNGDLTIGGPSAATLTAGTVNLIASGAITETANSSILAQKLTGPARGGTAASADLEAPGNQIAELGDFTTTGDFKLVSGGPSGPVQYNLAVGDPDFFNVSLVDPTNSSPFGQFLNNVDSALGFPSQANPPVNVIVNPIPLSYGRVVLPEDLSVTGKVTAGTNNALSLSTVDGDIAISGQLSGGTVTLLAGTASRNLELVPAASTQYQGANVQNVALVLTVSPDPSTGIRTLPAVRGSVVEQGMGSINAQTLNVSAYAIGGADGYTLSVVKLDGNNNQISALGNASSPGAFSLTTALPLTLVGNVVVGQSAYDTTVQTTLTSTGGGITIGAPGQPAALITDFTTLNTAPGNQVSLASNSSVWCFCGPPPPPATPALLPNALTTVDFISTNPSLEAALNTLVQSGGFVVKSPFDGITVSGKPTGQVSVPLPFFTPGTGGLNIGPPIETISSTLTSPSFRSGSPIVKVPFGAPVQPPEYVPPPVVTLPPPVTPPPSVTRPSVAPPAGNPLPNGIVPSPADTEASSVPSTGQLAQAFFTGMCVTPAGMCPQRSYSPIVAGTGCTCSGGGKIYTGVIQRNPPQ